MWWPLGLFVITALLELGSTALPVASRLRRVIVILLLPLIVFSSVAVVWGHSVWITGIVCAPGAYRLVNQLRTIKTRLPLGRLEHAVVRASLWLIAAQLLVLLATWYALAHSPQIDVWLELAAVQLFVAVILCISAVRQVLKSMPPALSTKTPDAGLPTLTVAIPARNETADLEACLESLIASNYPKLEILVLDDCSQNKRTPEIIRSYAHAGVRFLQGEVPPDNWLAKNYAYEQLSKAASGEIILFCGVDVRFQPSSLRQLVEIQLLKRKDMLSIMPRNIMPDWRLFQATTLIQSMRYAWELALPRRYFSRPPVLSTCWLIRRQALQRLGGFGAVSNSVRPESFFAKRCVATDSYSFLRSGRTIGLVSDKSQHDQHTTAVRVEYPRLRRRLELVALLSAGQMFILVAPYLMLAWSLAGLLPQGLIIPSACTVGFLTLAYTLVMAITYRQWLIRSLFVLPVAALLDLLLLQESMIRYEFFEVVWKERNICIPVMQQTGTPATL